MATSKSGTKAKVTKKSPAVKSTRSATTTKVTTKTAAVPARKSIFKTTTGEPNYPAIIIAEVIGTFVLTLVALLTLQSMAALYVGITVAILIIAVGAVSGAHLNPAVTFGLWTARKIRSILLPVYWIAQFVGAILAILVLGLFNGSGYPLDFSHFGNLNLGVLSVEMLGAAVFLFGFMAVFTNDKLSQIGKAFGIGFALTIGLLVASAGLTTLQTGKFNNYQAAAQSNTSEEATELPAELFVKGATLNPAVALAATEYSEEELSGQPAPVDEARNSRLGLDVIIGTLVGAAIGANLYLLMLYANRQQTS